MENYFENKATTNQLNSQIVITQGVGKNVFISRQNASDSNDGITGKGDIHKQMEVAFKKLFFLLKSCEVKIEYLIQLNFYIKQDENAIAAENFVNDFKKKSLSNAIISIQYVPGFVHPDVLVEIDGFAFISEALSTIK